MFLIVFCSGIVAEKTNNELFFVDKNSVTCDTSEGEYTNVGVEYFIFSSLSLLQCNMVRVRRFIQDYQ